MANSRDMEKALDFLGRYSWAAFVVAAFVLFIPDNAIDQIGLRTLRDDYKGVWWLVLVMAAAVWAGVAFRYFDTRVLGDWWVRRKEKKVSAERQTRFLQSLELRLKSLNERETDWIAYCLFYNVQTLSANQTTTTAQSLVHKGILEEGSGHVFDMPFHIPDNVWRYLLDHKSDFIPPEVVGNKRFAQALDRFRETLHPRF